MYTIFSIDACHVIESVAFLCEAMAQQQSCVLYKDGKSVGFRKVVALEMEDGSGLCYNVRVQNGDGKTKTVFVRCKG